MMRFRSFGLAALAVLSLASAAVAQQRVPTANDATGRTTTSTPSAIIVAPAGGVSGKGRPVAEDKGMPVQGRDTVTGLPCAIGPTATCQLPGSGGGGGGGAVTVASGADVVQGATTDTLATNTIFGNLQALKSVQGALGDAACATDNGSCSLKASIQRVAQRVTSLITALGSPLQVGGAVSIPSAGDVVEGATTDTLATNTVFGNLQALKSVQGAVGDAACATDNGSCSLKASIQRVAQRVTSLITAVGSPLQAGGSIGNTAFGISGTLPAFAAPPAFKAVDSGGGDATDTVNHAFKVTVVAGGAGGGAVTVASGADVVEGTTADTATTNSLFGAILAIKAAAQDTTTEAPSKVADGSNVALGAKADAACTTDIATCDLIALTKRLAQRLSTLDTDLATLHTDMGLAIPAGVDTTMIGGVNVKEVNGVAPLMGNGVTGTGSSRVTVASDNTPFTMNPSGATAANATPTENPVLGGCEFKTTTTAATTTQKQFLACGDGFGNLGQSITPAMATQITAQSATTGNTSNAATLAAAVGKFTYITGFVCTAGGATTGQLATVTLAGIVTGSKTYTVAIPTGATLAMTPLIVSFPRPIQGSAANTAISVTIGAAGTGNTAEQCNADGLQQ